MDSFSVDDLYRLVFSAPANPAWLKREKIDAVLDGTTPGQFLAYRVVLHTKGLNHHVATSYHHDLEQERIAKERKAAGTESISGFIFK